MNENEGSQPKRSDLEASVGKNRNIVEQSIVVGAGAELTVSSSSSAPGTVTLSSQSDTSASQAYVSSVNADDDFTDEDIENFFSDKPYSSRAEPECSHVSKVEPVPSSGIDVKAPCTECGSDADNWICLTCYKVYCSRYVNQHMLHHTQSTMHPIVLSFYDISIWCYGCDDFVEHRVLREPRDQVIYAKYGSPTEGLTPPVFTE